jgi:hypothetical protein
LLRCGGKGKGCHTPPHRKDLLRVGKSVHVLREGNLILERVSYLVRVMSPASFDLAFFEKRSVSCRQVVSGTQIGKILTCSQFGYSQTVEVEGKHYDQSQFLELGGTTVQRL